MQLPRWLVVLGGILLILPPILRLTAWGLVVSDEAQKSRQLAYRREADFKAEMKITRSDARYLSRHTWKGRLQLNTVTGDARVTLRDRPQRDGDWELIVTRTHASYARYLDVLGTTGEWKPMVVMYSEDPLDTLKDDGLHERHLASHLEPATAL